MYARKQVLIWVTVISALNIVLLAKLHDDSATARTQLEELTPIELSQLDVTELLEPNTVTYDAQETELMSDEGQLSEAKTEESGKSSQSALVPENHSAGSVEVHYVHKGDTLWKISQRYNLDMPTLLAYNRLTDPNLIRLGQRIEIPRQHVKMQVNP